MTSINITVGHKVKRFLDNAAIRDIQKDFKSRAVNKLSPIKDLIEEEGGTIVIHLSDLDSMKINISLSGFSPELHAKIQNSLENI
ncbi:hypothetical protein [Saccharicrinis fermentans]|uniref:Uncharacterized protein n=1 Tax=Saccharicrinis fermentans DSM 9555 = JCM 21142 TaxID=869213 RepID=W7YEN3_9BACT|nr:hypothetical protein [Saccharicrinis fermentans]GAF05933.1 hypothetical protein JCM21142_124698 [Saccharicrinis fermentans DSM 9555 = JCM 21142]